MITDQETHASYTSLQAAEIAASPGDTLSATGTCTGTTSITKNLTITGGATLDGDQEGSVLTIDYGVTVTISSLTITGGSADVGGGILNFGSVTVTGGSQITGNTARVDAGGIYNALGSVTLNGGSYISGNTADGDGGGIYTEGGSVTLNGGSHINGNTADVDGGGIYNGIYVATVTLNGGSTVTGNEPGQLRAPPGSVPGCSGYPRTRQEGGRAPAVPPACARCLSLPADAPHGQGPGALRRCLAARAVTKPGCR